MTAPYTLSDYSPSWPVAFEQEATRLRALLGADLVAIHHIGSTSVPGLIAKPVIDLMPVTHDIQRIDYHTPELQHAGYESKGEFGLPGRRFFIKQSGGWRSHHIHIYQVGNPEVERHLAFCAFLRSHASMRQAYSDLKQILHSRYPNDRDAYSLGKEPWINHIEPQALEWYRKQHYQRSLNRI